MSGKDTACWKPKPCVPAASSGRGQICPETWCTRANCAKTANTFGNSIVFPFEAGWMESTETAAHGFVTNATTRHAHNVARDLCMLLRTTAGSPNNNTSSWLIHGSSMSWRLLRSQTKDGFALHASIRRVARRKNPAQHLLIVQRAN